jgi:hypothetical protein
MLAAIDTRAIAKIAFPIINKTTASNLLGEDMTLMIQDALLKKWPNTLWTVWLGPVAAHPKSVQIDPNKEVPGASDLKMDTFGMHVMYYQYNKAEKSVERNWSFWVLDRKPV